MDPTDLRRTLPGAALVALTLVAFGTVGYRAVEGWSWLDSLYMTLMVLTTVGFGEVHPPSPAGKVFSSALMVAGIGVMLYLLTLFAQFTVLSLTDSRVIRRRKERRLRNLTDHVIVCGYGRVGAAVCAELHGAGRTFVVLEQDADCLRRARDAGYETLHGDATKDDALKRAGIAHAAALVSTLGGDPANLYVLLSAREMHANIPVIVRSGSPDATKRMRHAGATEVIEPYLVSGKRIAAVLLRPLLVEVLDQLHFGETEFMVEQVQVHRELAGLTVAQLTERSGAQVVAVRGAGGARRPRPDDRLSEGESMLLIGTPEELQRLNRRDR